MPRRKKWRGPLFNQIPFLCIAYVHICLYNWKSYVENRNYSSLYKNSKFVCMMGHETAFCMLYIDVVNEHYKRKPIYKSTNKL